VGSWTTVDWKAIFASIDKQSVFIRVPEKLIKIWQSNLGDQIGIEEERNNWDYIYDFKELMDLKGNRFHKKKNLLNQFINKYEYEYVALGPPIIEPAMAMQADWCDWRNCESSEILAAENRAVFKVFMNWDNLIGLSGGAILADQMIVAYTVAEKFNNETILIHQSDVFGPFNR
jgi:hypothetical protein